MEVVKCPKEQEHFEMEIPLETMIYVIFAETEAAFPVEKS